MGKLLWQPTEDRIKQSNMYQFMCLVNKTYHQNFSDYSALYQWSVNNISDFWRLMWEVADVKASNKYNQIIDQPDKMPGAKWFSGAKLNFAENLLRYRDDKIAIISKTEGHPTSKITFAELYQQTASMASALKNAGVTTGDRVVGFMPNIPQTIIAMLAAASIGAVWSSCSPDFGIKGVLDRFGQIKPKVIFTADGYFFKGKIIDCLGRIKNILKDLPSIEKVVVVPYTKTHITLSEIQKAVLWQDFCVKQEPPVIEFEQLPFDHPLYIMYSSGTTGLPKCMVQSAGGILLHQMKELILHTNLTRKDTIFYFTTCGWMMWNWLTCSLSVGASVVLFDGNPFYPNPGILWELAQNQKISVFGTSAGYLSALENVGIKPGNSYDLSHLNTLLSTGSPLSEEGFDFVYRDIKKDIQLASISGGTDLNGCFALGNPMGPVYSGELQCRGLGMKVEAFDDHGASVTDQQGELVCTAPFPSMPIYFWDDNDGQKYFDAYFSYYPNVWRHGDYITINKKGGMTIYGRSDTTLNPGGVRIGTSEIYRQLEQFSEIVDSVIVGQSWEGDTRVILFVQMAAETPLDDQIIKEIKLSIKKNTSPRHVPAKIIAVPGIPYTLNMKKVELAVKKTIEGKPVLNKDALRNPEVLDYYANIPELKA